MHSSSSVAYCPIQQGFLSSSESHQLIYLFSRKWWDNEYTVAKKPRREKQLSCKLESKQIREECNTEGKTEGPTKN